MLELMRISTSIFTDNSAHNSGGDWCCFFPTPLRAPPSISGARKPSCQPVLPIMERISKKPVFDRHCIRWPARRGISIEVWSAGKATGQSTNESSCDHQRLAGNVAYATNLNSSTIARAAVANENTCFSLSVRKGCGTTRKPSALSAASSSIGRKIRMATWAGAEGFVRQFSRSVAIPVQTFIRRAWMITTIILRLQLRR
jgi:hypothetical protein